MSAIPKRAVILFGFISVVAVVFLVVALLTAERDRYNPDVLTIGLSAGLDTLDPDYTEQNNTASIVLNVYENLLMYDYGRLDSFLPLLSTQVPSVQNGLITERSDGLLDVAFPIREGVRFHNGVILTPEDVAYSFRRLFINRHPQSDGDGLFKIIFGLNKIEELPGDDLAKCQAVMDAVRVDGDRVIFTIARDPQMLFSRIALGNRVSAIVSRDYLIDHGAWPGDCENWREYSMLDGAEQPLNDTMMGTGPFKFTRWSRGEAVVLERFDDYWREPAKLASIQYRIINDTPTRKLMFEKGDLDIMYVPRSLTQDVEGREGLRTIYKIPTISSFDILFNYAIDERSPYIHSGALDGDGIPPDFFADIDVRKAFNYAIDWETIIRDMFRDEASQSLGPIPRASHHVDLETPVYEFDLNKAEEHFRAAWGGELWDRGFHMTFAYNSEGEERDQIMRMLKANIESLNPKFNIEISTMVFPTYLEQFRAGQLPFFVASLQGNVPYPDEFIDTFYLSSGSVAQNMSVSEILDWDDLLQSAAAEIDPQVRQQHYSELQRRAYEEAVGIFLLDLDQRRWQRSWVGDWYYNPALPGDAGYLHEVYKSPEGEPAEVHPRVRVDFPSVQINAW